MNAKIAEQKKLKSKYGVTFTKNMSTKEILEAWSRVPISVLNSLSPEIAIAMTTAKTIYEAAKQARTIYTPIKQTYEKAKVTLDDATSAVYTSGAVTTAKVAEIGGKESEVLLDKANEEVGDSLLITLNNFI